jgi:anti-sigma B factor antagonist
MGEALTIEVRHEQGYAVVSDAGEIDISTATKLRECLFELAASGLPLVADLDQVTFVNSAGLAVLVGTAKRAAANGGSLYAVCARPKIRQLFRLTGLDCRIPLARTLDEALQALTAARITSCPAGVHRG